MKGNPPCVGGLRLMLSPGREPHSEFSWIAPDLVPEPLWFARTDGDKVELNTACMNLLGCARLMAVDAVCDMIHPDDRARVQAAWTSAQAGASRFETEFRVRAAEGRYRHVLARGAWHTADFGAYGVGTLSDREDAFFSREREALLSAANVAFSAHDDPDELIDALLAIIVPRYADYAVIDLFSEHGAFERFAFAGSPEARAKISATRELYAREGAPPGTSWHVAQTGEEIFLAAGQVPAHWPEPTRMIHRRLGVNSAIVVPLAGRERRLGALSVVRTDPARDSFHLPSVAFYADIAARTATVLERTRTIIALQRWEDVYRTLADEMPQLVGLTRADGSVFYLNRQHAAYTGRTLSLDGTVDWSEAVHPDDRAKLAEEWRATIASGERLETRYRLRRHDGIYRWFLNQAVPVRDPDGTIVSWIGTATDIDEHQRREEALRLAVKAGEIFASTLDTEVALQQLADTAASQLADWCGVYLFDSGGKLKPVAVAHVDPESVKFVREFQRRYPVGENDGITQVARTGVPERVGPITDEMYDVIDDPERRELAKSLKLHAIMNVPLAAGDQRFGAFSLATSKGGRLFDEDDERIAIMLAQRAGIALQNARLYERQRDVARTLQSAFLPASLPTLSGIELDAVYVPGAHDVVIGGDWYDADVCSEGQLTFSIGDVAGHDLDAAIPMGKMRQMFRALPGFADDPAAASIVADAILRREHPDVFVTAFLGVYDPATQDLHYVNAGHPPPFVRLATGKIERLEAAGVPLGLSHFDPPQTRRVHLPPASLLVAFTDGLIEIDRDIEAGENRLASTLHHPAFAICSTPAALLRALIDTEHAPDDIAILTIRNGRGADWTFDARDAKAAQKTREDFVERLATWGVAQETLSAAEVVFGELLGNVVRYTPGLVDIGVLKQADEILLRVLDRGPGLKWAPSRPIDNSESGRGLFLIEAFSRSVRCDFLTGFGTYFEIVIDV